MTMSGVRRTPHGAAFDGRGGDYAIQFVYRGEQLSYVDMRGEIVCEAFIPDPWIDGDSLRRWDGVRPVTPDERELVLARVVAWWRERNPASPPMKVIWSSRFPKD